MEEMRKIVAAEIAEMQRDLEKFPTRQKLLEGLTDLVLQKMQWARERGFEDGFEEATNRETY